MAGMEYRILLGAVPATRGELDRFEEIRIDQRVAMATEAELVIPICIDRQGRWEGYEPYMRLFQRVRIEVRAREGGPFVPLIDGPIVRREGGKNAEPGESAVTLVVHDDSIFLNREESDHRFDGRSLPSVVEALFELADEIDTVEVELPPKGTGLPDVLIQRSTPIHLLRRLAHATGMQVQVRPGARAGRSVGVFRRLPDGPTDRPPLVLVGPDRNVEELDLNDDGQAPARVTGYTLDAATKEVRRSDSGAGAGTVADRPERGQLLRRDDLVDMDVLVSAAAERSAWSVEARGSLRTDCYGAVLEPFCVVPVHGAGAEDSGTYTVFGVRHTLGRSRYEQQFTLRRKPVAGPVGAAAAALAEIF